MTKRPETASRKLRVVSESARPEIAIQHELIAAIADELPPLFARYGAEFDKVEGVVTDPDWASMFRMEAAGQLRVVTVRAHGTLVGFAFNVVGPHLMYRSVVHGITNAVWLDPAYRAGWLAVKFLRRNLDYLAEWGCKRACIGEDANKDRSLALVYQRLGYRRDEVSYARALP